MVLSLLYQLKAVRLAVVILMVLVKRAEERTEHVVPSFFFARRSDGGISSKRCRRCRLLEIISIL